MNQAQRTFLIKKIEESSNLRIRALESSKPKEIKIDSYIRGLILNGDFQIAPIEDLRELVIKQVKTGMALEDNWRSEKATIKLPVLQFFVIPDDMQADLDDYNSRNREIEQEIAEIRAETNQLVTRIQLASDKTLQSMIDEVDDMGDIKLMDNILRNRTSTMLGGGNNQKRLK